MPKRVSDEVLLAVLDQVRTGVTVLEACQALGVSEATFHRRKDRIRNLAPTIERPDFAALGATFDCELFRSLLKSGDERTVRKLRREVSEIFSRHFSMPKPIHPRRQLSNLKELEEAASKLSACLSTLDADCLQLIGRMEPPGSPGWNYATLFCAVGTFGSELEADHDYQQLNAEAESSSTGGRVRDIRIKRAVVGLANVLSKALRQQPTHTHDPDLETSTSLFDVFCKEAFRHFVPGGFTNWSALDKAVKEHVTVIDFPDFHSKN